MNILLCCEHFHPSIGGVQKMMYELGVRFVKQGHKVTVATGWRSDRKQKAVDGIDIISFRIAGNATSGMKGELQAYQNFLINGRFDFLLVMAAQQWTFDAMLSVLEKIPYKKFHIPCGYSGFYLRRYKKYYKAMSAHLRKFDQLIYNASKYRDIDYARRNGVTNISVIPAGASEFEFVEGNAGKIREELGVNEDRFLYLSVGAPAFNKGHKEILQAYLLLEVPFASTLVLNGNYDKPLQITMRNAISSPREIFKEMAMRALGRSSYNIIRLARRNRDPKKRIIFSNLEREKLIHLFFSADLFLFASHVEYSPLVIYECLAAGLPFLSIPVGNVDEIVKWSGGGVICAGTISKKGYSLATPVTFSREMRNLSLDQARRAGLSTAGRQAWLERFTWGAIAKQIEALVTAKLG